MLEHWLDICIGLHQPDTQNSYAEPEHQGTCIAQENFGRIKIEIQEGNNATRQ